MILQIGEIVTIKGIKNKRIKGLVTECFSYSEEESYTIKATYFPAPKSVLKNKSKISKVKISIKK